ncbi:Hypothetical predicted protein [Mytilus galloprovincialis]|uniref:NXPE C-terminal domain-containing protein n=1 Tax=Mytilus galloprovincialis TaxID=29158 RepID=A0A8B6CN27_MYTGA|nr:Hypothetical predicted protein [Mytilus galloprovincialis]
MSEKGKGAGSTGYVVEHGNGTYIGVIRALLSGSPHIKIPLSFAKESIGLYVNYIYRNGMLRTVQGIFKNARGETGKGSCGIHTLTKHGICDFTSLNYGMRWFCLLPNASGFNCLDCSTSNKNIKIIKTEVHGDKFIDHPEYLCRQINPSVTWNISSPVGYLYNETWHNLLCQNNVEPSYNRYVSCLTNREIYMVGDSTVRHWLMSLAEILNLAYSIKLTLDPHYPIKAFSKSTRDNITVTWAAHEFPFFAYTSNATINYFKPARYHLNVLRSKNPIVVLHWYVHIGFVPLSVYEEHVMNAKDSIVEFLDRVPDAKIFIKGPHNLQHTDGVPYDFVRYLQDKIIFKIFDNIKHKIVYLNQWDITVASESYEMHPSNSLRHQMIHELLSYIC